MPSSTPETEVYGEPTESRERRRRSLVTFLVVLLLLFFAAWYALSYIRAEEDRRANGPAPSSATPSCSITPKDVQVNVYNATTREGLAGRVAEQLEKRGFVVKTVANDPKKVEVTGAGQLRFGPKGAAQARLVAAHVSEAKDVKDQRQRTTVDIVLGPGFRNLVSADLAERRGC